MKKAADYIAGVLKDGGIINKEDEKIYSYGIELFIMSIVEIMAVIVLSAIIGKFAITVVYLLGFMPIRVFSGGYHAKTRLMCFGVFLAGCILMWLLMGVENMIFRGCAGYIYSAAAFAGVVLWAPVEHMNKTMSEEKRMHFRKISIVMASIWLAIGIVLNTFFAGTYTHAFLLGQLTLFLTMGWAELLSKLGRRKAK